MTRRSWLATWTRSRWPRWSLTMKVTRRRAASYLGRAVALGETLLLLQPDTLVITKLADCRASLAVLEDRLGRSERARSLVIANNRMLADATVPVDNPEIAVRRVLAHDDLRRFHVAASSVPNMPAGVDGVDALLRLLSLDAHRLSAEGWGTLFAEVVRTTTGRKGTTPSRESEAGYDFTGFLVRRAAEERKSGDLDEARLTADRLHAFAHIFVLRHPDQATAHLSLCSAFIQFAKNAWQVNDLSAVEPELETRPRRSPSSCAPGSPKPAALAMKWPSFSGGSRTCWQHNKPS